MKKSNRKNEVQKESNEFIAEADNTLQCEVMDNSNILLVNPAQVGVTDSLDDLYVMAKESVEKDMPMLIVPGRKEALLELEHRFMLNDAILSLKDGKFYYPDYPTDFGIYNRQKNNATVDCMIEICRRIGI